MVSCGIMGEIEENIHESEQRDVRRAGLCESVSDVGDPLRNFEGRRRRRLPLC